jgi:hypothetical protein
LIRKTFSDYLDTNHQPGAERTSALAADQEESREFHRERRCTEAAGKRPGIIGLDQLIRLIRGEDR